MLVTFAWLFTSAAALGLGVLEWLTGSAYAPLTLATDIAAGWAFCVAGLLAWGDRRPTRIALLLEATGFTWLLGALVPSMFDLYRGPLVHLLLSYPAGRVTGRVSRGVVLAAYISGLFGQVQPVRSTAPVLLVIVALVAIRDARRTAGPLARARMTAAAASLAVAVTAVALSVGPSAGWLDPDTGRLAYALVLGASGMYLAADLRWGGWAREAVTRVVIGLGGSDEPATVRGLIADALGDRSLVIGYVTDVDGEYVDETGQRIEVPEVAPGRSMTMLAVDDKRVGILVREDRAEIDEALVDGVAAAAQLALANAQLQNEGRHGIQELAASRHRLVAAADSERSRIQRELEKLIGLRLANAEATLLRLSEDEGGSLNARALVDEVRVVSAELRHLTSGMGSRSLVADGLRSAVALLALRSVVPIEVDIPPDRWPALVETTAYFVCSEGLANATKHAAASRIDVHVTPRSGYLDVEILDDGRGGADIAGGSGLRGLADRVNAIGGSLRVEERPSGGTNLAATLPLVDLFEASGDAS